MLGLLIRLVVSAAALFAISGASSGQIIVKDATSAVIAALVLGLANSLVKPILQFILGALTLPLSCLTLGLWSLVLSILINGALFYAVAEGLGGFEVKTFGAALVGAVVLSGVNALASALTRSKKE